MATGTTRTLPTRDVAQASWRGMRGRCPQCGKGKLFASFLKVNEFCPECGEALHHHRADDAPPYVVITIVGHIIVGGALYLEKAYAPEMWIQMALWVPLTVILSVALLQPVKGALIGVQWALRMHGFDPNSPEAQEPPPSALKAAAR
nr:DUF983 domain-containing protein [Terrihabitans soli]